MKFVLEKDRYFVKIETRLFEQVIAERFQHRWRYASSPTDTVRGGMDASEQSQVSSNIFNRLFTAFSCFGHLKPS